MKKFDFFRSLPKVFVAIIFLLSCGGGESSDSGSVDVVTGNSRFLTGWWTEIEDTSKLAAYAQDGNTLVLGNGGGWLTSSLLAVAVFAGPLSLY